MSDVRDTLRALATVDRCFAVWCAAQCARRVLHLVPEGEERPLRAIEAAEAWAREPTESRAREYRHCAKEAWLAANFARHRESFPPLAAAANLGDYADEISAGDDFGAGYWTVRQATIALKDSGATSMDAAADILATITAQRWPLVLPSLEAICAAPGPLAVAWDRLAYVEGTISVPELLRAHEWSQEQGLDWSNPVARAVAERVTVTGDTAAAAATKEA